MLAAVILSAGASRRMGTPKALLPYESHTFLEHLLEISFHPRIGVRRIVLGADAAAITRSLHLQSEEIVVNDRWDEGQLSSLHAALRSLPEGTDGMLVFLVDHPLVSGALVNDLIERFYASDRAIILPVYRGRRGHPVIFPARLYNELLHASLEKGARSVVWAHAKEVSEVQTEEEGSLLNLNDPSTLQSLRRHIA
ncbi:MAG TPA: nucleotidyltransferase family protein [Candidatus Dormibacteraeota bacterium]|nr:nucleotidyltransferase family protein [Candidatus Dormibacteraeota bacterium]